MQLKTQKFRGKMATEIYGRKKVEAHLASLGAYFDRQNAAKAAVKMQKLI